MIPQAKTPVLEDGHCKTKTLFKKYYTKSSKENQRLLRIRALRLIGLVYALNGIQDKIYRLGKIGGGL